MRVLLLFFVLFAGCAPAIGDSCGLSSDCSVNGDRICDLAYPGGYCTVLACDPDTCPGDSACVEWRFMPDRTAVTYCMALCSNDDSCRENYRCLAPDDPFLQEVEGDPATQLARVIDLAGREAPRLCVAVSPEE